MNEERMLSEFFPSNNPSNGSTMQEIIQNKINKEKKEIEEKTRKKIKQQIKKKEKLEEADHEAKKEGFIGGLNEAFHYHKANCEKACCSHDPQALSFVDNLEKLWDLGEFPEALKMANATFGKPVSPVLQSQNTVNAFTGSRPDFSHHEFANELEYKKARLSSDPVLRTKAQKAWKRWMKSFQDDPKNPHPPFPINSN